MKHIEELGYGTDWINKRLYDSIRVNTIKIDPLTLKQRLESQGWILEQLPWYSYGFIVKNRTTELGNTLEHFLGYYYSQSVSSMMPVLALEPKGLILDMAAAPGGKTSQIAQHSGDLIIANDVNNARLNILAANLQRLGVSNVIITRKPGQNFHKTSIKFDRVLLDAPCSSLGTAMHNPRVLKQWSPKFSAKLSKLQKSMAESAFLSLKKGGILVYSTCTITVEENEEIINHLISLGAKVEDINLDIPHHEGITDYKGKHYDNSISKCWRIHPDDLESEGFFIARLRR